MRKVLELAQKYETFPIRQFWCCFLITQNIKKDEIGLSNLMIKVQKKFRKGPKFVYLILFALHFSSFLQIMQLCHFPASNF